MERRVLHLVCELVSKSHTYTSSIKTGPGGSASRSSIRGSALGKILFSSGVGLGSGIGAGAGAGSGSGVGVGVGSDVGSRTGTGTAEGSVSGDGTVTQPKKINAAKTPKNIVCILDMLKLL